MRASRSYRLTSVGRKLRGYRLREASAGPSLLPLTASVLENGAQGADILIFAPQNAIAPSAVSLSNVVPLNAVQMNADGVTLEYGSASVDFETTNPITFTASFTDAGGGPYSTNISLTVLNVNEAPIGSGTTILFPVPPGSAASSPAAFTIGMWSVANANTNGDATFTISTLPSNGGSAITALQYQIDGGAWTAFSGTATGDYTVSGFTDGTLHSVKIRAVNAVNPAADSDVKSVTTTGVPAAFTAGLWHIDPAGTSQDAIVTVTGVPSGNGLTITGLEYKIAAGAWTALGGAGTGTYPLNDLFTNGVSTNVMLRAVNSAGNGPDGDVQSVTTSGIQLVGYAAATSTAANYTVSLTGLTGGIGSAAIDGDLAVVYSGISCGSNVAVGINTAVSTDWSEEGEQYANDTRDANGRLAYKRMGVTPDTSVSVLGGNNASFASLAIVAVFRGVNAATPLDVAAVLIGGTNTAVIDPSSISPVTNGAMVLVGGINTALDNALTDITAAPSGFTDLFTTKRDTTNIGGNIAMAIQAGWSSGAVDAGAFTGATDSVNESWVGFSIALRPA